MDINRVKGKQCQKKNTAMKRDKIYVVDVYTR